MRLVWGAVLMVSGLGCASVLGLDDFEAGGGNAPTSSGSEAQGNPGPAGPNGSMSSTMTTMSSTTMSSNTMTGGPGSMADSSSSGVNPSCADGAVDPGELCLGSSTITAPTIGSDARNFALLDCDGDGDTDILVSDLGTASVSAFRNDGAGNLPTSVASDIDFDPGPIGALFDANSGTTTLVVMGGTGRQNHVVAAPAITCGYQVEGTSARLGTPAAGTSLARLDPASSTVSILWHEAPGNEMLWFARQFTVDFPEATDTFPISDILAVDIVDDANLEIVMTDPTTSELFYFSNDGTAIAFAAFFPTGGVGATPIDVETADLDQNGAADLVTANAGDGTVSVLLAVGGGQFSRQGPDPQVVDAGTQPNDAVVAVRLADINQDSFVDVLALASDSTGGAGHLSLFLNPGSGVFSGTPSAVFDTTPFPESLDVADMNGDGAADVVIGNFGDPAGGVLTVLLATP